MIRSFLLAVPRRHPVALVSSSRLFERPFSGGADFWSKFERECEFMDSIPQIHVQDAKKHLDVFDLIVDVREADEVQHEGTIVNAKHIPMATAIQDANSESLQSLTKDRKVLVYCKAGSRSQRVAKAWKNAGIDVVNLVGGYSRWK